jgi:peptidoglycan/xylan/chitin deacetylase (PgdA/CDA1 family)
MIRENSVEHQIALTFDVENDCGSQSYKGIQIGLPKILHILKHYNIMATFFITGEVAELFPTIVQKLSEHYEIGCHGYHHESLQEINSDQKILIKTAKKIIEETINHEIWGFRAPFLHVSQELFDILAKVGFKYDSSLAWFKISHWVLTAPLKEFGLMFPNVFFRFPCGSALFKIGCLLNPLPVLYFHPWEAIDTRTLFLHSPNYSLTIFSRPDRWLNSGPKFLSLLSRLIHYFLHRGFKFNTLSQLYIRQKSTKSPE